MLAATFPRNVFFACFSAPFWTPLYCGPLFGPHFSSPYSRSDLLFFVKVRFSSTLTLSHLVMWTVGSVPFLFGKRSFGILANCSLCGTETTLSFLVGPVCSSFFLCSLRHSASFLLVSATRRSLSFLFFQVLALSSTHCPPIYLSFCLKVSGRNSLLSPPLPSGYNRSPDTHFFRGIAQLMS